MIFADLPRLATFRRPGHPGLWVKLHKEKARDPEGREVAMSGFEEVVDCTNDERT